MARKAVYGLLIGVILLVLWIYTGEDDSQAQRSAENKPKVMLMTSLPIIWGEGASMTDILSDENEPAPIYQYWQEQYQLTAVDSLEGLAKSDTDIVLLAQPKAMAPADLADLDGWIRAGGKALILTDPALLWHSDLPIGDNRRPLVSGLLSPLLQRWGLDLLAPTATGENIISMTMPGFQLTSAGVGSFALTTERSEAAANCKLSAANIMARCDLGRGKVILFADADFIDEIFWTNDSRWQDTGMASAMLFIDSLIAEFSTNSHISKD